MKAQARSLYVKDGLSVAEIAVVLEVSPSSVYLWRRQDSSSNLDWDKARSAYNLSPREMIGQYANQVRELMLDLAENPEKMAQAATADALTKHIANLRKLNPKHLYKGALADLVKGTDKYLATHDNDLRGKMARHWPGIRKQITDLLEGEVPLV
ncbi:MAG: DUF1804 family protein [Spirochaetota bacterium]